MNQSIQLALILGSVRPGRFCEKVAAWAAHRLRSDGRFGLDVIDPVGLGLTGASAGGAGLADIQGRLGRADGFVIVTPEYNHSFPGALKLLIDAFSAEWQAKPTAFVSYGGVSGGLRAVEHLRPVFAELHAVTLRDSVSLANPWNAFRHTGDAPLGADEAMSLLLDRLEWWTAALRAARQATAYNRNTA